jgi:alkanesulfonate monooxygenase SsuD/methylene tetrahydromethanopterin reductase-like flavin-dependent oxidoreductase (luciferase family)
MINLRSIGLAASVPMTYWEPFNIARAFSALDNLSGGRAAWLAVPSSGPADEANFPRFAHQHIKAPYARALEFVELTRALWDSWEDDALKFDKENAIFTDRAKVHRIAYQKKFFASDGPLNAPRPVQGHPPILVSDVSAEGLAFGAAIADVVMARESSAAEAASLRARATALSLAGGRATAPLVLADLHFVLGKTDHAASAARAELDVLSGAGRPPMTGLHFTGTAGGLAELMLEWFGNGSCDGFQLLPAVMPRDLAMFAADVVPLLRGHDVFRGGYLGTSLREHLGLTRPMGRVSAQGEA